MKTTSLFLFLLLAVGVSAQQQVQVPYSGTAPYSGQAPYSGTATVNGNLTLTIPSNCTLAGTVITCTAIPVPPPGPTRTKLVPSGSNDQPAIYGAAAKGPIELGCPTSAGCTFSIATSTLPSGADIWIDDGVTISDFAAYSGFSHMFVLYGNTGISLAGSGSPTAGLITMPLSFAQGTIAHNCVWIENSSGISITGLRFDKCAEDAIYIGKSSTNVHISHIVSTNPLRNGCSVTDQVTNILIDYSSFGGAKNIAGGIADGCDAEPNGSGAATPIAGQFVKQVVFDHDDFSGNAGDGFCMCLYFTNSSTPLDYTVTNNTATGNGQNAYDRSNWPSPMNGAVKGSGNMANGVAVPFPN